MQIHYTRERITKCRIIIGSLGIAVIDPFHRKAWRTNYCGGTIAFTASAIS